ncbi:MAG: crotonobetainyl-CoA--carnitine CoA-transferase, partial [Phenylobacterium sp.]|nr:crotonobetainyl-CoA--carnitine CoA-transferase [Phenylobacterium sp.]
LKRLLYLNELYRQVLPVHGVVMQFGVRWGRDLAAFSGFRTIYEPFNISRLVIGFDTFEGFPSVDPKDGSHKMMVEGGLSLSEGYDEELGALLAVRRGLDPLPHLERGVLVPGDVTETLPAYLKNHPETIIALAHFDLDLYAPTKVCLEAIEPHLTRGSVVAFDELASGLAPGETEALRDAWGLGRYPIRRSVLHSGQSSYIVIE